MSDSSYLVFPSIDPVIFSVGPLSVRWYGMMYLVAFVAAYLLAQKRLSNTTWTKDQVSDMLFWGFIGVILGGRLGYVFFYQFGMFLDDPLYLFKIWTGGMSFHGGLIGVLVALFWQAKRMGTTFLALGDFVAPLVPIGLGAGRIGNFLNAELWGRTTDVPWAVIFPNAGNEPRHPSQLYEFALEGVVLFVILWMYSAKPRPVGAVGGVFLLGYGSFRFIIEFFREPDAHIGLYQLGLSQGQLLCLPMILLGLILLLRAYKRDDANA
ncbi:prolipoprotein diacylglyceryl transferase [Alteromonas sp. KUL49]|uniref:prolipoprotein diacylglyceryl transferase n=1 Tax=Alteromonas sp. KUL49 TaxID=2480798 RepID=UPI00102F160D|nr:prolipoprotein diacylglyceryl transferase [Alteromonas sp. KUL49]TAP39015.1 prolipoprotein diacylglyceryl transferase [Alteromonas sp. KUL49]GEA12464.1 prolipoprotein diacylglyceryl transferase [Alteromonas sp. KUL49]